MLVNALINESFNVFRICFMLKCEYGLCWASKNVKEWLYNKQTNKYVVASFD